MGAVKFENFYLFNRSVNRERKARYPQAIRKLFHLLSAYCRLRLTFRKTPRLRMRHGGADASKGQSTIMR